jgi:GNAT superfamily N-acetyltransferase
MTERIRISTDKRLDIAMIHGFLANESCRPKNPRCGEKTIKFILLRRVSGDQQVGFGRVISDYATTAYVGDVFILEPYRRKGLGKLLIKTIVEHPKLNGLRLWFLGTKDAHDLYRKYGFKNVAETPIMERLMTILDPDVWTRKRER